MAGAALAADSETFFASVQLLARYAEQDWRAGARACAAVARAPVARRILFRERASPDPGACAFACGSRRAAGLASRADGRGGRSAAAAVRKISDHLSESTVARLHAQRDSFAPSERQLTLLFQAEFGCGRSKFRAEELQAARVLFGQVVLMVGAALAADAETYAGAEQLWSDMQDAIGARGRALARRILDLLFRDADYTDSERRLIESLAAALSS